MENELKRPRILLSPVQSICNESTTIITAATNVVSTPISITPSKNPIAGIKQPSQQQQNVKKRPDRRRSSATVPIARSKEELENLLTSANIDPNKPVCFFLLVIKMSKIFHLGSLHFFNTFRGLGFESAERKVFFSDLVHIFFIHFFTLFIIHILLN
jgi:hypothetical protein